ncbi:MAG: hypothetical protein L0Y71_24335 [Gemmataceae bacterium]|nr:hypothetical protein [Gemmataceae bacterium]
MAATVVNALSASHWAGHKPAGYKGQDLDKALKAYEPLAGKTITIPSNLIPSAPKAKVGEVDTCISKLKHAVTELEKGKVLLSQIATALKAVQSAALKASTDLNKLSKGKDVDESEYKNAAISASSIAGIAADRLGDYL